MAPEVEVYRGGRWRLRACRMMKIEPAVTLLLRCFSLIFREFQNGIWGQPLAAQALTGNYPSFSGLSRESYAVNFAVLVAPSFRAQQTRSGLK